MSFNSVEEVLKNSPYVLFYEKRDQDFDKLDAYVDETGRYVDLNASDELRNMIGSMLKVERYPALYYRGGWVYACDDVDHALEQIDKANDERIRKFLGEFVLEKGVTLFIKGRVDKPYCKYTKELVGILKEMQITEIKDFNILDDALMRYYLKRIMNWPTFPMIFINGKFVEGLDRFKELIATGDIRNYLA